MVQTKDIVSLFRGEKAPYRITIGFLCDGIRQFEHVTKPYVKTFKECLEEMDERFTIIGNTTNRKGREDVSFYSDWGGFTYIHIAVFNKKTLRDFASALVNFSKGRGKLEIKNGEVNLIVNKEIK